MNDATPTATREHTLAGLRKLVRAIERPGDQTRPNILATGVAEVDAALPDGGLTLGALHEIRAPFCDAAACGFAMAMLGRLSAPQGHFVWVRMRRSAALFGVPYGPGLRRFGVSPERFTLVEVNCASDVLWAIEEGLKTTGLSAVYAEDVHVDLTASRRLQLAAEAHGVTAFIHLTPGQQAPPSAALTRWRVRSQASPPERPFLSRWDVMLERCRGGTAKHWRMDWDETALALRLASTLPDLSPGC